MNDEHRLFVQFLMAKRLCNVCEVRQFFKDHCNLNGDTENTNDQLVQFITIINNNIRPLNLEIKKGIMEDNGMSFFALISTMTGPIPRLLSDYTVPEMEFFKKIVSIIVEADHGTVSSSVILNSADQLEHRITKTVAEQFLNKFTENDVFTNVDGYVFFSPYTILELDSYLKTYYGDYISLCSLCKQIVFKGSCACEGCGEKMHYHCEKRLFKNRTKVDCPKCKTALPCEDSRGDNPLAAKRQKK